MTISRRLVFTLTRSENKLCVDSFLLKMNYLILVLSKITRF